jgi:predicted SnoaL-like aldol condensation-catalyzing enzyme
MIHGRLSYFRASVNWIVGDIVRIQRGILDEPWDIQDEATEEQSKSKASMFRSSFPVYETEKTIG